MFVVGGGNYIEYQNLLDYSKVSDVCVLCLRGTTLYTKYVCCYSGPNNPGRLCMVLLV